MSFPVRVLILLLLFVGPGATLRVVPQTQTTKKEASSSVSGKVTLQGKPAAGIVVGMRLVEPKPTSPQYKATTDADGSYRINNIVSGNYLMAPVAPAMVLLKAPDGRGASIVITAGENVEGLNFELARGGVISGKVIDTDGRPVVEIPVSLTPVGNDKGEFDYQRRMDYATDDRGIYRIFGVRAGRYKVSAGDLGSQHPGRPALPSTFYPDTQDESKAGIVEIDEGGEAANIDIKVGPPLRQFTVTGRVVESETGKPVADVQIGLARVVKLDANYTSSMSDDTSAVTDRQGQFRFKNIAAGKYELSIYAGDDSTFKRGGPVGFDVSDADVTDLVVKLTKGAVVEGTVVFEGGRKESRDSVVRVYVTAIIRSEDKGGTWADSTQARSDGSFVLGGLNPGTLSFSLGTGGREAGVKLVRVERDGVVQPNAIPLQGTERISGLRLFAVYSSGSISGLVQVVNGTLPPDAQFIVQLARTDDPSQNLGPREVRADARGRFLYEGLAAGNYQVMVIAYLPNRPPPIVRQLVTVTDGAVSEVTVKIDLTGP